MILDTTGLSAIADGNPALEPLLRKANEVAIPVIVLGEYRYGIKQSRNRTRYEQWLEKMIVACRVLEVDKTTAVQYAEVRDQLKRQGRPIPGNDLWIAALTKQYALPLLSRDQHFDHVAGLERIEW